MQKWKTFFPAGLLYIGDADSLADDLGREAGSVHINQAATADNHSGT
jgi:hypothetical protein